MKKVIYLLFVVAVLSSCTASKLTCTRGGNYPKMYEENAASILVMPPINKTVNVEAKEYFYTSMATPLAEKGYYVISPFVAMDLLKSESAYDSEMFINGKLSPFKEIFGADAVLFTIINTWSKSTIGSSITVNIEYILKSTTSNEVLFTRKGELTLDTSISSSGGGLAGMLVSTIASAVNTALTDKVIAARMCNNYVLSDMPEGKYSSMYGKDKDVKVGDSTFSGVVRQ